MKLLLLTLSLITFNMSQAKNSITIYSGNHQGHLDQNQLQNINSIPGFAVVKQSKESNFEKGLFNLKFDDVAAYIDPTTVNFSIPDNPEAAAILDQNFQFDLVSTDKLLLKYLDQTITVNHNLGNQSISTQGKLLSTEGGLTLQINNDQVTTIRAWNTIDFPALPGGLLTKPTLVWLLNSQTSKPQTIALTYQTKGMTWWADYNVILNNNHNNCSLDLSSWVTLVNKSGASYDQTQLKLIAGDVNRTQSQLDQPMVRRESYAKIADNTFSEQSLYEYHMYKLPRKIDLPNNSTKQIQLIQNTNNIKCNNILRFNGSQQVHINYHRPITDKSYFSSAENKVESFLNFENSKENNLGLPLPAGRVRVNMIDTADDSLEFIGEDSIDHTAKNKTITLKLGQSFDVTGQRKQRQFEWLKNSITEQFEITIDNQKNVTQQVEIIEPLYRWSNWQITQHDEEYTQIDSSTIQFTVSVPAESSRTIKYTVLYQWPETFK